MEELIRPIYVQQGARPRLVIDTIKRDFNQDGVLDSLITGFDGGSWFGNSRVHIKNGKINEAFEINNGGGYGDVFSIVASDSLLFTDNNASFKMVAKTLLLPHQQRQSVMEASAGTWILWHPMKLLRTQVFSDLRSISPLFGISVPLHGRTIMPLNIILKPQVEFLSKSPYTTTAAQLI